jgi:hypothetical protein
VAAPLPKAESVTVIAVGEMLSMPAITALLPVTEQFGVCVPKMVAPMFIVTFPAEFRVTPVIHPPLWFPTLTPLDVSGMKAPTAMSPFHACNAVTCP